MEQLRQWPPLSMQGTDTEPPQDLHKQAPEETGGGARPGRHRGAHLGE